MHNNGLPVCWAVRTLLNASHGVYILSSKRVTFLGKHYRTFPHKQGLVRRFHTGGYLAVSGWKMAKKKKKDLHRCCHSGSCKKSVEKNLQTLSIFQHYYCILYLLLILHMFCNLLKFFSNLLVNWIRVSTSTAFC